MFLPNERRDWTTHLCLSGDSLVDTPDGPVPLRNIKVGMSVLTPSGQAKVLAAGPVKRVNEMMRIETADGRVLECTPDHPIFTERGLLSADALRYSDVVLSEGSDLWRSALSRSREDGIGFRDAITLTPARDGSTDISGSRLMAPSLIGTIFTTSMEMARTTLSKISNASIVANPAGIPCTNAMSEASYSHQAPMHSLPPQSGIAPKKAGAGTKNTEGRLGGTANGIWLHVRNVVESFAHHIRRGPNTVTRIARHRLCGEEEDGLLVYDLTVEKHHCFWANGILVGNCDAFRYLSLAWRNIPIDEPKGIDPQWLQDWQKVIPPRPGQVPLPAPPRDGNGTRIKL